VQLLEAAKSELHSTTVKRQQTPKPEAQLPAATPPALEHSDKEKHVPFLWVVFDFKKL